MSDEFQPRLLWRDLLTALALLTRLPLSAFTTTETPDPARASRVYPLVGALVGLVAGLVFWIASALALPALAAALVAVAAGIALTGALHEDGLADVADGFGGARERDAKLAIMRDSRIGTYGVLILILSVGLRAAALAALADPAVALAALVAAHAGARGLLPGVMALLPLARHDGLAAATGQPAQRHAASAAILGALVMGLALGLGDGIAALAAGALAVAAVAALARAQIGGVTGDVLGTAEQAAEIAILLCVAALA